MVRGRDNGLVHSVPRKVEPECAVGETREYLVVARVVHVNPLPVFRSTLRLESQPVTLLPEYPDLYNLQL